MLTTRHDRVRLELLADILSLGADEMPPEQLIAEAARLLARAVGDVDVTFVELLEDGLRPRFTTVATGLPHALPLIPEAIEPLEHGPLVINDVLLEPWLEPAWANLQERGVRAAVDIPLRRNGKVVAVLWFNTSEPRRWQEEEVRTLSEAGAQLGVMVERAESRAQREAAVAELRRRDGILEAVTHGAERLLAEPDWRDAVPELIQRLGETGGLSRSYLFCNSVAPDGELMTTQLNEWCAPGIAPELDNELLRDLSFREHGLERWPDVLRNDEILAGNVRDFSGPERALLEAQHVRSIMTVPIFVDGSWWGFIGFDDCWRERVWSRSEIDALRLAASLIAAAIKRERSEETLREQKKKLRAVFDSALDAIYIVADDRRLVDLNPAGSELLGVPRPELLGREVDDFVAPERLATLDDRWRSYLADEPTTAERRIQRPDGTTREIEVSGRPQFLPGLNLMFARDVTDRKRLEAELLSAQRLESLGRLAGGVAHDFNNLLTAISGYADLVQERVNGDEALAHDVGEIQRAAGRAAELTRQLLAFGRRQVLQPRAIDLNVVLEEIRDLLGRLLTDMIELVHVPGATPQFVHADPGQIEQVIVNLVVNARAAMPDGGRVTISTRTDASGETVELQVADTGNGMDEETRARIFEPFFTTREDGVGLGLASVYGIVHQSGGEVTVESNPGSGSTFVVRLPRVEGEAPRVELDLASDRPVECGKETILLVEDEDVVRALARRILERCGYSVLECANGTEALDVARTHDEPIQLLLTDVVMPGLRGHEVAQRVALSRPEIRVLYMSGYADQALLGPSAIAPEALIEKPFAVEALARRVREALELEPLSAR